MKTIGTTEAARALGVSRRQVRYFIADGRLPAVKVGRDWIIDPSDLDLVRCRKNGRPAKQAKPPRPCA